MKSLEQPRQDKNANKYSLKSKKWTKENSLKYSLIQKEAVKDKQTKTQNRGSKIKQIKS